MYFPRYFEWFDASTAALFEQAGLPKAAMLARYNIAGIPLIEARSRFMKPSTFGDRVVIESRITVWRRGSFDVGHKLFRGDDLAVEGFETRVWTERTPRRRHQESADSPDVIALFSQT